MYKTLSIMVNGKEWRLSLLPKDELMLIKTSMSGYRLLVNTTVDDVGSLKLLGPSIFFN